MAAPDLSKQTDKGRFYVHPDPSRRNNSHAGSPDEVPSITNVINTKAKPGIAYWGYKQCGLFVAENIDTIIELAKKDPAAVVDVVKGAPHRSTAKSGNRGDLVHDWIDQRIRSGGKLPTNEEVMDSGDSSAREMWRSFLRVEEQYAIKWLHSEFTVWSDKYEYAGTGDWIAEIYGKVTLGDTKTGNNIYPEVGLQVAAVAYSDYAIDDDGQPFNLPHPDRFAVLHIRPRYARLSPLTKIPECFQAFLGLRAAFSWNVNTAENVIQYAPKIVANKEA